MKTLSIRQPWANLIVHGIKDIENRSWRTSYRGRVLVHAPAKAEVNLMFTGEQSRMLEDYNINDGFLCCAIIGSVEIVNCVQGHWSPWAERGCWNWVLKNPVLFDQPILGVKGKLGFWEYPVTDNES